MKKDLTIGPQGSGEWHARMLRAWHLAVLRCAATLDNADRLGVLAAANEIDRLGQSREDPTSFSFFRRTSEELCSAILQPSESNRVILRRYLAKIDDARLKRAFAAAIEIHQPETIPIKRRSRAASELWRGLPSRRNVRP